ncbi:acyltransferase [Georgenia sp. Marseille-Q6866]
MRLALYYGFADKLPYSPTPIFGSLSRVVRRHLTSRLFDFAGAGVNVERGVWFGSGQGLSIGTGSGLGLDSVVMGPVSLGANVMMGPRCLLVSWGHNTADLTKPMSEQGMTPAQPITVEDDVWLGGHVVILPGVTVGTGAVVAAGSVVTKDVPQYAVVGGNPARVLRYRRLASDIEKDGLL